MFWPGEFHGQRSLAGYSPWGCKELDITERLSLTLGIILGTVTDFIFLGSKVTADGDCSHEIKRCLLLGSKAMTSLDSILKRKDITFLTKLHIVEAMFFSSSHVWIWDLDHKEGWTLKNWCFWIVGLEKILEGPLDTKEIKPVNPKGNQPWIFIRRTDATW